MVDVDPQQRFQQLQPSIAEIYHIEPWRSSITSHEEVEHLA
jgi:hypothetical protein